MSDPEKRSVKLSLSLKVRLDFQRSNKPLAPSTWVCLSRGSADQMKCDMNMTEITVRSYKPDTD